MISLGQGSKNPQDKGIISPSLGAGRGQRLSSRSLAHQSEIEQRFLRRRQRSVGTEGDGSLGVPRPSRS